VYGDAHLLEHLKEAMEKLDYGFRSSLTIFVTSVKRPGGGEQAG
jgi:hypothetical protein